MAAVWGLSRTRGLVRPFYSACLPRRSALAKGGLLRSITHPNRDRSHLVLMTILPIPRSIFFEQPDKSANLSFCANKLLNNQRSAQSSTAVFLTIAPGHS